MNPRPERFDDAVFEIAFAEMWPKIKEWVGINDPTDEEDQRKEAHKTLHSYRHEDDGYKLAREFDDWGADSSLVEVLDEWSHYLYKAHQGAIRKWALENPIEPRFKIGDTVTFDAGTGKWDKKIRTDGKVIQIDIGLQIYTINCPAIGHILPNTGKSGVLGTFQDFEKLHELNPEQANAT